MKEDDLTREKIRGAAEKIKMPQDRRQQITEHVLSSKIKNTANTGNRTRDRQNGIFLRFASIASFAIIAILCLSVMIYHLYGNDPPVGNASSLLESSVSISNSISGQEKESSSGFAELFYEVTIEIPKWYSPGVLSVSELSQTEWGSDHIEGVYSGGFIYINEMKADLLRTGEHADCKYFRFNTSTGTLDCLDHAIRAVLEPEGILRPGDEIFMDYTSNCTDRYLMFYINHKDAQYRGSFTLDLETKTYSKLTIDLRKNGDWRISNDYTYLVVGEYSDRWRYYKIDILTGTKTEILDAEENSTYSFGLSNTNRYFWYATYHGNSKDTWCYYDLTTAARRVINTIYLSCVTKDDRYIVYIDDTGLRRMELDTGEDELLAERGTDPYWEGKCIEAYDHVSGKVLLSWWSNSSGQVLYIYDTVTQHGEKLVGFDETLDDIWIETYGSYYQENSYSDEAESLRNSKGADAWLMDETGQYLFFYNCAPKHAEYIYCYGMNTGELFKVALPKDFYDRMKEETAGLFNRENPRGVSYRLYLSEDATKIYLTYEVID